MRMLVSLALASLLLPVALPSRPAYAAIGTPTSIGTAAIKASAGTTISFPVSAAVAAGSSVIVAFAMDPATGTVACSDSKSNTYTNDADVANGSGTSGVRTVLCSAHNVTALTTADSITVTHPSVATRAVSAAQVSGLALVSAKDQSLSGTGTTGTTASVGPSGTTEIANELVIGAFGDEGVTLTAGTGYTGLTLAQTTGNPPASNISVLPEFKIIAVTGTQTATATVGNNSSWAGAVVTYRAKPSVWDSYESTCTTVTDSFTTAGSSVCVKTSNVDPFTSTTTYKVRLYDGAASGALVTCFIQDAVSATTLATGITYLLSTAGCDTAGAGTWKSVVFENAATPPATYTGNLDTNAGQRTNLVAAQDTFTVDTAAIPEFSTGLAAAATGITVAAFYLWMRRRMGYVPVL